MGISGLLTDVNVVLLPFPQAKIKRIMMAENKGLQN